MRANAPRATQQYPTRQAIVTPPSSLHRGDWGLKRPLPDKIQKQSTTPNIRIIAADTIENFTEFESAGDHTRTLSKLQELNLAMMTKRASVTNDIQRSVFETDATPNSVKSPREGVASHATDGVSSATHERAIALADMTEDEFERFLWEKIDRRRDEFVAFIKKEIDKEHSRAGKQKAIDVGSDVSKADEKAIPEEQFAAYIDLLHRNKGSATQLLPAILQFFGIAPILQKSDTRIPAVVSTQKDFNLYDALNVKKGTASTRLISNIGNLLPGSKMQRMSAHEVIELSRNESKETHNRHASLGISYNRSNAYIEMHPEIGPLQQHSPVPARVLQPRILLTRSNRHFLVGLAGVVAAGPNRTSHASNANKSNWTGNQGSVLDTETPGGETVYVNIQVASVDRHGRLDLQLGTPSPVATAISRGVPFSDFPTHFFGSFRSASMKEFTAVHPANGDGNQTHTQLRRVNDNLDAGSGTRKYARGHIDRRTTFNGRAGAGVNQTSDGGSAASTRTGTGASTDAEMARTMNEGERTEAEKAANRREERTAAHKALLYNLRGSR